MRYTSELGVTGQQNLISFETAAHHRKLEHCIFNDSETSASVLFMETYDFVC